MPYNRHRLKDKNEGRHDRYKILAKSLKLTRNSAENKITIAGKLVSDAVADAKTVNKYTFTKTTDYTTIKATIRNHFEIRYLIELDVDYCGHVDELQYLKKNRKIEVTGYLAPRLWHEDRQHDKKEHSRYRIITESLKRK